MNLKFFVALITAGLLLPASASSGAAAVHPDSTATACDDASFSVACLLVLERGGGYAIKAEAKRNTAVYAITRSTRDLNDPHDPQVGLDSAVYGADLSTNTKNSNQGVLGTSLHATGVEGATYATTIGNIGVFGESVDELN
ncbi:MAG: hypothetical protein M3Z14_06785 [Candidatus Eremiobacteraeota bacterium]|nr:hypothetical protein [Candidatus Eremiobacteraeota bacterium]